MAQCITCKNFYPPMFTEPINESGGQLVAKCIFCIREKDDLEMFDSENQETIQVNKWKTINDYNEFLTQLSRENKKVQNILYGNQ